jgi:hypothetical protein
MPTLIPNIARAIRSAGHNAVTAALRLHSLIAFGIYLMLWSKLFKRHAFLIPVEEALLATKSVHRLPPELDVFSGAETVQSWSRGFAAAHAALFLNLRNPDKLSPARYAQPAPSFRAIYLWDSAFIAQIWKIWDPHVAWDILRSVVALRKEDRLQHYASLFGPSKFTQPPLLAWSLQQLEAVAPPEDFLRWAKELYEPLRAYHHWLYATRQLPNGLFAWAHPYESGVENAPRFGSRDERRLVDTRELGAPDFSSYVVLQCEALAAIARRLGRDEDAALYQGQAVVLRRAINELLWDEAEGLYFDRDANSGAFVKSRTIASLLPLWAGIPDRRRAERLRRHIIDPKAFNTVIPLPSVALNDATFEKDMWRGPVWVNVAFAVIAGLERYGFYKEAADIAFRLCDGVYRTFEGTGRFHEFYDPERHDTDELHRKRGNIWKRLTLGPRPVTEFVGWSGLVNTLAVETLFGFRRTSSGAIIRPRFPPRAEGLRFRLKLPSDGILLDLTVQASGAVRGICSIGDRSMPIEAEFGMPIELRAYAA